MAAPTIVLVQHSIRLARPVALVMCGGVLALLVWAYLDAPLLGLCLWVPFASYALIIVHQWQMFTLLVCDDMLIARELRGVTMHHSTYPRGAITMHIQQGPLAALLDSATITVRTPRETRVFANVTPFSAVQALLEEGR